MKFTCLREHLAKALFTVERAVAKTSHLPTLLHLLLDVSDGKLKLATTDLEIGITSSCQGKSEGEGKLTVPAKTFSGLISTLGDEKVILEQRLDVCVVKSGSLNANVKGLPADDFPIIPVIENETPLVVDAKQFLRASAQALEAIGGEGTRPELNGILFQLSGNALTLVATDSFRLSAVTLANVKTDGIVKTFFQDHTLIVPGKTARELIRIIDPDDADLTITLGENQIQYAQKHYRLVSRLIEGTYPRYEDIIPASALGVRVFERQKLINALKQLEVFSGRLERIEFFFGEGRCRLESEDPALGSASEEIAAEGEGPEEKFAFNIRYLLDGLALLKGEHIHCEYNERERPVLFHNGERDQAIYLVMPMKLES